MMDDLDSYIHHLLDLMHFFNNVACVVYDHIMEKYDRRDVQGDLQAIQYRMQELWVGDGGIMPNLYS